MKLKKLLAVLYALCMMTMNINGAGIDFIVADAVSSAESSETAYSGSCGENAVWEFNPENGTLTISGTGYVNDYMNYIEGSNQPWNDYKDDITSLVIEDGITGIGETFYNCENLKSITCGNNCIFNSCALYNLSLKKLIVGDNCTFYSNTFGFRYELSECTINGTINFVDGSPFQNCLNTISLKYDRPVLDYKYKDNTKYKTNTALSDVINLDDINIGSTISSSTGYNNGYDYIDYVQEIQDSTGMLYAAIQQSNGVSIIPYGADKEMLTLVKENFAFGAAVFDDEDNIYVLWAKSISDDNIEKALEEEYANVVVTKYNKAGNVLTEYGIPVNLLDAQFPYDRGNAHLGWKNNVLLVYFHTEWTGSKFSDGLNHQGSVAAAVNTETSEIIFSGGMQGSHAFGSCMIPTDYGYAAIQMGDGDITRGINFNSYCLKSPEEFKSDYLSRNGYASPLYHSSGMYGTNSHHIDGNYTYTHMGGLAKSNTTYAIAGKSEKFYTSDVYYSSDLRTGNYDVFVKLVDQTLISNASGLAGESRTDEATGEIVDRNVVWLTECNETEKAGQVKIVTLDDGSYCVLWEKFVNNNFDSVRYVIMDECGNIIRRETVIDNARLSDTSVQPVVEGDTLKWAVGDSLNNSLIWYTVNINEFDNITSIVGDADCNGSVNIADVVMLQKWLLGSGTLTSWRNVDLCKDGKIDVFDMIEMRKLIAKK